MTKTRENPSSSLLEALLAASAASAFPGAPAAAASAPAAALLDPAPGLELSAPVGEHALIDGGSAGRVLCAPFERRRFDLAPLLLAAVLALA